MNNFLSLTVVCLVLSTLFAAPTEFPACPSALLAPPPPLTDAQQKAAQEKSDAQPAPVVAVTCRLNKFVKKEEKQSAKLPFGKLFRKQTQADIILERMAKANDYVALANIGATPEQQQAACDRYANTPNFGPAKPIDSKQFSNMGELRAFIIANRFGGFGGHVVMCKTRLDGVEYAQPVPACCLEAAQNACESEHNIADPISCHSFTDNVTLKKFLDDHGMYNGMQCTLKTGGTAYRTLVPSCSKPVVDAFCNPEYANLNTCSFISKDPKALADWSKKFVNVSLVTCKINKTGVKYRRPTVDCSEETEKSACSTSSKPDGCKTYKNVTDLAKSYAKLRTAI